MRVRINHQVVKAISITLGVVLIGALLFGFLFHWEKTHSAIQDVPGDRIEYNGTWYEPKRRMETYLIIGVDKFEKDTHTESYNNPQQADMVMLMTVDYSSKTYTVLQLNRDTMTRIPMLGLNGKPAGSFTGQLALAHTYGTGKDDSCLNTVHAVSDLLGGIRIDHYVSLTMDAVSYINDAAGGVTMTMPGDFTSIDPSMTEGATVTLNGEQALEFVRARGGTVDDGNVQRMERQRQYMTALKTSIDNSVKEDQNFLMNTFKEIAKNEYLVTDCTTSQLSNLNDSLTEFTSKGFAVTEGEVKMGTEFIEFYVDEDALKKQVIDLFYTPAP